MEVQYYPDELNYINAKLHILAPKVGGFLEHFLNACLRADGYNYPYLRPMLLRCMEEYPADPERLKMEVHDSGEGHSERMNAIRQAIENMVRQMEGEPTPRPKRSVSFDKI